LIAADIDESDYALTIYQEGCRAGDIETVKPDAIINSVSLDDRAIRIDQHRHRQSMLFQKLLDILCLLSNYAD